MNPISKLGGVITHPARTAVAVAGATVGVGLRTAARVVGWAVERVTGPAPDGTSSGWPEVRVPAVNPSAPTSATRPRTTHSSEPADTPPPVRKASATTALAKKAPVKKTAAKKTPARKAPSKKAAVLAPALGLTEAEVEAQQPGSAPLMDSATAKAVSTESEMLRRAADADKG